MLRKLTLFARMTELERRVAALENRGPAREWSGETEDTAARLRGAQMEALLRYDGTEQKEGRV